ncbi:MAG: hypothetical protein GF353_20575 [Candidatus Lokiarchaeota archaeon]|nr:hypothetical protein [Candidatus Lokiarchaeota archaeon]
MIKQMRGMFFQMLDRILTEYNPEIAEEAAKELSFDIKNIKPMDWIAVQELYNYINKTSPSAREVISKRIFPTVNENTPLLKDKKDPKEVIESMNDVNKIILKYDKFPQYNVLEANNGYLKLQIIDSNFNDYLDIEEGLIRGIFEMFKILRVHIKSTKVAENELMMEIKWEN